MIGAYEHEVRRREHEGRVCDGRGEGAQAEREEEGDERVEEGEGEDVKYEVESDVRVPRRWLVVGRGLLVHCFCYGVFGGGEGKPPAWGGKKKRNYLLEGREMESLSV